MMSVGTRHLVPSFVWEKEQEGGEAEMRRRRCGERVEPGTPVTQPGSVQERALTVAGCTL